MATQQRYARLAGAMFLLYIAAGMAESSMFATAVGSGPPSARLASLSAHATLLRVSAVFSLVSVLGAVVLAVALFAMTRHDRFDLAMMAMSARLAEAMIGAVYILPTLGMLAVADTRRSDDESAALYAMLDAVRDGAMIVSATCFAVGSALFSILLLRAPSIPRWLASLGLGASLILLVALPLQLASGWESPAIWLLWLPMLVFEIVLALLLLIRGGERPPHGEFVR